MKLSRLRRAWRLITLLPILVAFGLAAARLSQLPGRAPFLVDEASASAGSAQATQGTLSAQTAQVAQTAPTAQTASTANRVRFERGFLPNPNHTEAHSATQVALRDGRVRAFWLAGNEGSQEAVISTAVFDPRSASWSMPSKVVDAASAATALKRYVRKVGNAVAHREADGRLTLFFVTVSVGGWAGSSIATMTSTDDGVTWTAARRLITSPFLNLSTLVRQPAVAHSDGTLVLPVYHEFVARFGELLRLDSERRVIDKQRLSVEAPALQPNILVRDGSHAIALLRNGADTPPRSVLIASTSDAGQSWTVPAKSALPNPGTPVSGVTLPDGRLLLTLNDAQIRRRRLSLMISSDDGASWTLLHTFEDQSVAGEKAPGKVQYQRDLQLLAISAGLSEPDAAATAKAALYPMCRSDTQCDFEFSYPSLLRTAANEFHLVYTWNRAAIRTVRFNQAWLDERVQHAKGSSGVSAN